MVPTCTLLLVFDTTGTVTFFLQHIFCHTPIIYLRALISIIFVASLTECPTPLPNIFLSTPLQGPWAIIFLLLFIILMVHVLGLHRGLARLSMPQADADSLVQSLQIVKKLLNR